MRAVEGRLLRVHVGERDRHGGRPLHEAVLDAARDAGLAGATVLRGMAGYGAHHVIHRTSILRLADDLPLVIEIVDRPEAVDAFLPTLAAMVPEGLVTVEKVEIILGSAAEHGAVGNTDAP